ncbi:phosphoribosylanthranilate isomerase [Reichenbachiella sp. MALMAid0571]|uniref:phosphoribosylanthranilate isomerase n=1 Tax=Reichenbachiella sp. MALMAid0571 TaxID=3143939 RepID=UPI0032DECF69
MTLKTFVKVGNITNLSDARYCAGMGVDLLGFPLDEKSTEYIDTESYKEIVGWISGPQFVGEFESNDASVIMSLQQELKFEYIEVNNVELANALSLTSNVIYKIDLESFQSEGSLKNHFTLINDSIKYILLESETKVSSAAQKAIDELASIYPVLKAYELNASTILSDIATVNIKGIALKGSKEVKPGFKDYDELADILEALEDDN